MFRRLALLLIAALIPSASFAQPFVQAVYNAANYRAAGLPASGIAQGSIFSVYSGNLPASCNQAFAFPVPAQMCGVSLTVTVNGTSVAPLLLGVYYGYWINAILPSLTPTGNGTITVSYNGKTSAPFPIQVVSAAFGAFTATSAGMGQASVTDVNYNLNTIIHPLHPGDIGILWGTGLGAITSSDAGSPPFGNVGSPTLYVGNTALTTGPGLLYAGRSGSWPGLDQINFTVPQGVQGCSVPIAVAAGGAVGNVATIAVAPAGQSTCTDSVMGQTLVNKLAAGGNVNFGYVRLESRVATISGQAASGTSNNGDFAYATFSQYTPQTAYLVNYGVSAGYCVAIPYPIGLISDFSPASLDAGSGLTIQGPLNAPGPLAPSFGFPDYYYLFLGNAGKYLYSDYHYTIAGTGGANIGAFSATELASNVTAQFSGILPNTQIPRTSDFTVQWDYPLNPTLPNAPVTIGGFSYSSDLTLSASFQCTAPAGAQKFTIPAWILSTMPPTGTQTQGSLTYPVGEIWIGEYNAPTPFTAPGLDGGVITDVFFQGAFVYYQ
ncbi:MAG: hypothetical protein WBL61_14755 [Bryobacteraceae bacterium]